RPPRVEREAALRQLARRYLIGHAPADERDLARWVGLPLRDARAGLAAIAGAVEGRAPAGPARTCLLDQWDPVLVGWRSRADLHAARRHRARGRGRAVRLDDAGTRRRDVCPLDVLERDLRRVLEPQDGIRDPVEARHLPLVERDLLGERPARALDQAADGLI